MDQFMVPMVRSSPDDAVAANAEPDPELRILLAITDTGGAIPLEVPVRVLKPFFESVRAVRSPAWNDSDCRGS